MAPSVRSVATSRAAPTIARLPGAAWLRLTAPIAALVALVSVTGLAVPDLYRGPDAWTLQAVAQDAADLVQVVPLLVGSALLAARGSRRAWLVWLGALSYLVYTFLIYAFAVEHNRLFLAYVAVLGLSVWALIGGLAATDMRAIASRFRPDAPLRPVALLLGGPGALFYLLWLAEEVPAALSGTIPAGVVDNGVATNPVHVVDLAMMLPAMIAVGAWLWRREARGYALAPVLLVNMLCQNAAIATMMAWALRAGQPGEPALVAAFAGLAVVVLAALVAFLRALDERGG